jgi:hypothetical protein
MNFYVVGGEMFGYVRPVKSELFVKDSEFYTAVYCGLCHYGGKNISPLTRWLLNYDFVLLALLRMSLTGENICVSQKRCPYKLKKKNCVCADGSYGFVASVFGMLTYGKLQDDIRDEKGVSRFCKKLARPIFSHIAKKCDRYEGLSDIIKSGLDATQEAEESKCASPDRAADGFATMMKKIASYGLEENEKIIAESCGYHIGRYIYLADVFDDLESDEKSGNYNPFIFKYGSAENALKKQDEIKETLFDSLNAFSNYYALIAKTPHTAIDRLIFNITELGGRSAVKRISERKNKNEQSL